MFCLDIIISWNNKIYFWNANNINWLPKYIKSSFFGMKTKIPILIVQNSNQIFTTTIKNNWNWSNYIIFIEKYFGEKTSKINFLKASYNDISKVSVAKCHPKSRFTDETTTNNNRSLGRRRLVLKNLLIFVTSKVLKCS